jgi:hypothetical protein
MAIYELNAMKYKVSYDPAALKLSVITPSKTWSWRSEKAFIQLNNGDKVPFTALQCITSKEFTTGVETGIYADYTGVPDSNVIIHTAVGVNKTTDELNFTLYTENEKQLEIKNIYWPAPFDFDLPENAGYSIIPEMQGVLIPSKWGKNIPLFNDGKIYDRAGYMAFFGQVDTDSGSGYAAIFDTPYDAGYHVGHIVGGETLLTPYFRASLGAVSYKRRMIYTFLQGCNYNCLCKTYRNYLDVHGKLITLKEKIARNPNVAKLIGTPVVHDGIAAHISPDSHYYNKDDISKNDWYNTFDSRGELLKKLKDNGVDKAYLHYDGWGAHGYDNLHPDPFPVHEAAGGSEGMKRLSETARGLGYIFGIHDQYRDYYYDADSFSNDNAIMNADGGHPFDSTWYGGKQTILCASLAPDYVRRNYTEFKKLGIVIEGSYLDVFSVVELDECFNPAHPMTRQECVMARRECLDYLSSQGIIPSSEETTDAILPSIALCHHSPLATTSLGGSESEAIGIPLPLFNLVFHDCVVIPWFGVEGGHGGWGIPSTDSAYLWGLLCGGTTYYETDATKEIVGRGQVTLGLHKKIALCEMVKHEFIDGNYRRQKTTFSDGTTVEINLDTDEFTIN